MKKCQKILIWIGVIYLGGVLFFAIVQNIAHSH